MTDKIMFKLKGAPVRFLPELTEEVVTLLKESLVRIPKGRTFILRDKDDQVFGALYAHCEIIRDILIDILKNKS